MRRLGFALLAALIAFISIAHPKAVRADTVCYISGAPTPAPIGNVRITFPSCSIMGGQNILNVSPVGPGGTPVAVPTDTAGIPYTHPTSLPPAYPGSQNSGGPALSVVCDKFVSVSESTPGDVIVQLVPNVTGERIYVCGFTTELISGASTTWSWQLFGAIKVFTNCDTLNTGGPYVQGTLNQLLNSPPTGSSYMFVTPVSYMLCSFNLLSAAGQAQVYLNYAQF